MLTVFKVVGVVILVLGVVLGLIEIITKDPVSTSTIYVMLTGIGLLVVLYVLKALASPED